MNVSNLSNVRPRSLEENIEFSMKWFPMLFDSKYGRIKVLAHMFLSYGTGYEWVKGRLFYKGDDCTDLKMWKMRKHRWESKHWRSEQMIHINRYKKTIDSALSTMNSVKDENPKTISEKLELAWMFKLQVLFHNDIESGGSQDYASPIWSRPYGLNIMPIVGLNQIVGHTPQRGIRKEKVANNTAHYFIDALAHKIDALEIDFS